MQINVSKSIDFIISKYDSCEKILYIYTFDVTVNEDPNILDGKDGKIIRWYLQLVDEDLKEKEKGFCARAYHH